jgi:hypothetical protein
MARKPIRSDQPNTVEISFRSPPPDECDHSKKIDLEVKDGLELFAKPSYDKAEERPSVRLLS